MIWYFLKRVRSSLRHNGIASRRNSWSYKGSSCNVLFLFHLYLQVLCFAIVLVSTPQGKSKQESDYTWRRGCRWSSMVSYLPPAKPSLALFEIFSAAQNSSAWIQRFLRCSSKCNDVGWSTNNEVKFTIYTVESGWKSSCSVRHIGTRWPICFFASVVRLWRQRGALSGKLPCFNCYRENVKESYVGATHGSCLVALCNTCTKQSSP